MGIIKDVSETVEITPKAASQVEKELLQDPDAVDKSAVFSQSSSNRRPQFPPSGTGQAFYLPPYNFDYRRRDNGVCGCEEGYRLITNEVGGQVYWACVAECLGNATLSDAWTNGGTGIPYCLCPPGSYFSSREESIGCTQIPICPGVDEETGARYFFDFALERCIIDCPEGMFYNNELEQCLCEDDSEGRPRSFESGACVTLSCTAANYPSACSYENEYFQTRLIAKIFGGESPWMSNNAFQACYERKPKVVEDVRAVTEATRLPAGVEPQLPGVGGARDLYVVKEKLAIGTVAALIDCYREACPEKEPLRHRFGRYRNGQFEASGSGACICEIKDICGSKEIMYDPDKVPPEILDTYLGDPGDPVGPPVDFDFSIPWSEYSNVGVGRLLDGVTINVTEQGQVVLQYTDLDGEMVTKDVKILEHGTGTVIPPIPTMIDS